MATSGTVSYTQDRIELVKGALRLAGVLDYGEDPDADVAATANAVLNLFMKRMQAQAPHLWTQTQGVLFIVPGQQVYNLGPSGSRACRESDLAETTLSVGSLAGATTVTLVSVDGIASGDQIGVELASGARQWSTVSGAPSGLVVTLADALTANANAGATVFAYTTLLERPVRITDMQRRSDGTDIPIDIVPRQTYFQQPTKTTRGPVLMVLYSPQLGLGSLYVWPTGASVKETLRFTFERSIEDMTANADDFDVPQEWLENVKNCLAYRLGKEFGAPPSKLATLKADSEESEAEILAFDQEYASISFAPDLTHRRR